MPNNLIEIDYTNRRGAQLVNVAGSLALDKARLAQIRADMDQMTDGVSFSTLETAYGIPTGKGQSLYSLVVGATDQIAAAGFVTDLLSFLAASF